MNSGLENKDNIYDIVYADEITESRFIMCAIKGYCLGKKANIVNLKKGLVFELDFDIPNLQLLLRAKLVFKQAKGLNLKGIKRCPTIMYSCVEDWTVIFDRTHILDIINEKHKTNIIDFDEKIKIQFGSHPAELALKRMAIFLAKLE
jgi:hypothetical protein